MNRIVTHVPQLTKQKIGILYYFDIECPVLWFIAELMQTPLHILCCLNRVYLSNIMDIMFIWFNL
jgi:hypothetical protein